MRFSCFVFDFVFVFCFLFFVFVLFLFCFSFKMFNFPTIILGQVYFFWCVCVCVCGGGGLCVWGCVCVCVCRRLIKFLLYFISVCLFVLIWFYYVFFCFFLFFCFCFCFQKFHPPLISNGAPLSLFHYTDDGGHYVIDNFELPCNSVKNLIPIWNFTNTFIQQCEIIWEFQIRWGGTSLLRPLWISWRYLKAYSLMSNTGRFQNFKNLIFFFFAYFRSPPLRSTIPKRN